MAALDQCVALSPVSHSPVCISLNCLSLSPVSISLHVSHLSVCAMLHHGYYDVLGGHEWQLLTNVSLYHLQINTTMT